MFLAGICSIVMALSISHAGHPHVGDSQDAVIIDLLAKIDGGQAAQWDI